MYCENYKFYIKKFYLHNQAERSVDVLLCAYCEGLSAMLAPIAADTYGLLQNVQLPVYVPVF